MANPSRTLFIISDRTGITLENLVRTLITQFDDLCCERIVLPFLDTPDKIEAALKAHKPQDAFDGAHLEALIYAEKLTVAPAKMVESDVAALRQAGWDDGEILEINQVVSYFAYANRTVLGLGVTTDGDILGLSPSDSADPDNWQHR